MKPGDMGEHDYVGDSEWPSDHRIEFRKARVCACGDHGFVGLTRGFVALFSPDKLALVEGLSWSFLRGGPYARARSGKNQRLMHRVLTGALPGEIIDHRNQYGLDNQDFNLRRCTQQENAQNKRARITKCASPYKGVWAKREKWTAGIYAKGATLYLGSYSDPVDAARAYDRAAIEYFGEFAATNKQLGLIP